MDDLVVNSVFTLQDMLTGALSRINAMLKSTGGAAKSLSQRMGKLALAMAPIAVLAGTLMMGFGSCTATAMEFEKSISAVGAVARATPEQMRQLERAARDLGATTSWTAMQVAEAEKYLAMAGFSVADNIAALPGVLNMAAAAQMDLGRAADISSDILSAFKLEAKDMTMVADTLTKAFTTSNTTLELMGDSMKYVAPVAAKAGMKIQETAAMVGMLANIGIKGSQSGTVLRGMLTRLAAPAGRAQKALAEVGISAVDAAGNLRNPITVLGELAGAMEAKNFGSGKQLEILKHIMGEEAMAGAAELVAQEGAKGITKYLAVINDYAGTASDVASGQLDNLAGDITIMGSAWEGLSITIGKIFIPVLRPLAQWLGKVWGALDNFIQSPIGGFLMRFAAGLASAVIGVTLVAGAIWGLGAAAPFVAKGFTALKGALLGLGAPFWIIIGVAAILYAAWKNNFGGMADTLKGWWNTLSLVVDGVLAVFGSLKGGVGEIRGELAQKIEAAGLVGVVTTISRVVQRFRWFFKAAWMEVQEQLMSARKRFDAVFGRIGELFTRIGREVSRLFGGGQLEKGVSSWFNAGRIAGGVFSWLVNVISLGVDSIVSVLEILFDMFAGVAALFRGDFASAAEYGNRILENMGRIFSNLLDCLPFGLGDKLRGLFNDGLTAVKEFGASVLQPIQEGWQSVTGFFDGINLAECGRKIIDTLIGGITGMKDALVETVSGIFSSVREFLPFSDAKRGPFSDLTASGAAIISTLGQGAESQSGGLVDSIAGIFGKAAAFLGLDSATIGLGDLQPVPVAAGAGVAPAVPYDLPQPATPEGRAAAFRQGRGSERKLIIQNLNVTLPDVSDAQGFADGLKNFLEQYDAGEEDQ